MLLHPQFLWQTTIYYLCAFWVEHPNRKSWNFSNMLIKSNSAIKLSERKCSSLSEDCQKQIGSDGVFLVQKILKKKNLKKDCLLFCVVCFSSFFFSCIIFSWQIKWPIQESLIQNWKGNIRKHILFQEGKKKGIEIFDWWLSELVFTINYTSFVLVWFLNWWKSLPYFLLNFYGNRYSTGNTNSSKCNHWSLLDPGAIGVYWTAMFLLLRERKFPFTLRHSRNILTKLQCIYTLWCKSAHSRVGTAGGTHFPTALN